MDKLFLKYILMEVDNMKTTDKVQPGYKKASAAPSSGTHEKQMNMKNHSKSHRGQDGYDNH